MNQQTKNQKRTFPYITVCLIAIAVLIVAVLVYSILDSTGITGKLGTAAKSDNFRISDNELSVYEYHSAISQLSTEFMYYQYGIYQDTYGITKQFSSATEYAYAMLPMYVGTGAFADQAYAYAQQYLAYCEGAKEAGVALDEETIKELNEYMDGLKETAKSGDMSFRSFINTYIGKGVSEDEVYSAMEKYYLAIEYAEILEEDFSDAVTDKEMEDYRENNKGSFYTSKYTSYVLANASLEEKAKECKSVEEIKAMLIEYYVDQKWTSLYKDKITDAKVETEDDEAAVKAKVVETLKAIYELGEDFTEHFKSSDTDTYKKAGYQIVDGIKSTLDTQFKNIKEDQSTAYVDLSDETAAKNASELVKWLFGDGRAVGDKTVIKEEKTTSNNSSSSSSSTSTTTTTTYTWYLVTDTMVIDTEKTKDAYYFQLADDKDEATTGTEAETGAASGEKLTAAEKADAMFAALEADKTTAKFDELAKKYGMTTSTALKENITETSAKSTAEALAEWLYAEGRKEGDITLIKTDDKTPKYFVAYFVEENEETWKVGARQSVTGEKITEWFEDAVKKYNVTVDTKAPETTAEAAVA